MSKKLRGTIKYEKALSAPGHYGRDNGFVFSSDIRDWQQSKTKKAHTEAYQNIKALKSNVSHLKS